MPERSVGRPNKCMRFLKSLFGRGRKGKYDLAEANRRGGVSEWDAGKISTKDCI